MTKQNYFTVKVKSKSTEELLSICNSKGRYADEFVLAALWELEVRNELPNELNQRLTELEVKREQLQKEVEYKNHFIPPDLPRKIKLAAYLLYLDFAIELLGFFILGTKSFVGFNGLVLPGSLITLVIGIFIHMGNYWAKFVFFIVFFVSTSFFVLSIKHVNTINAIQQVLITISLFLILSKESKDWYKKKLAPID